MKPTRELEDTIVDQIMQINLAGDCSEVEVTVKIANVGWGLIRVHLKLSPFKKIRIKFFDSRYVCLARTGKW